MIAARMSSLFDNTLIADLLNVFDNSKKANHDDCGDATRKNAAMLSHSLFDISLQTRSNSFLKLIFKLHTLIRIHVTNEFVGMLPGNCTKHAHHM
jgi:hypothetical protein